MKFICVCSGISSPSAAWKPLGWTPLAYAEIDPFASAVLAARYGAGRPMFMPDPNEEGIDQQEARSRANAIKALNNVEWGTTTPNYGDFTRLRDDPMIVEADVIIGGTPCQDFSLAGLRASLSGARGNLTMEFIRLANAVDDLRRDAGKPPVFVSWENVPGILSTKDNAFGAFLGGLVGSERPILPPKGRGWTDAGVVSGPQRMAAWRIMDAQHFGLAQRRRRLFVLASGHPRAWSVADALLPILDSMCGHPPPGQEKKESVARSLSASTGGPSAKEQQYTFVAGDRPLNALPGGEGDLAGNAGRSGQGARGRDGNTGGGGDGTVLGREAYGGRFDGPVDVSPTLLAHKGSGVRFDLESDAFVVEPDAGGLLPSLTARPYSDRGAADEGGLVVSEPIPFDTTQITNKDNRSNPKAGDPSHPLVASGHAPAIAYAADISPTLLAGANATGGSRPPGSTVDNAESLVCYAAEVAPTIGASGAGTARTGNERTEAEAVVVTAFSSKDDGGDAGALAPTLRAMNHDKSHQNAGGQIAVAFSMRGRDGENMAEPEAGDVSPAIRTGGGDSSKPMVAITRAAPFFASDLGPTLAARAGAGAGAGGGLGTDADCGGGLIVEDPRAFNLAPTGPNGETLATETQIAAALTASGEASKNGRGTHIVQAQAVNFEHGLAPHGSLNLKDQADELTASEGKRHTAVVERAQAFKPSHFTRGKDGAPSEIAPALTADADKGDQDAILFAPKTEEEVRSFTVSVNANGYAWEGETNPTLMARSENPSANLFSGLRVGSMVRRLTLVECERLQGFPDNFTLIPWSDARRDATDFEETVLYLMEHGFGDNEARVLAATPDGPRYRVLGNSMAKDVIEYLGDCIATAKRLRDGADA